MHVLAVGRGVSSAISKITCQFAHDSVATCSAADPIPLVTFFIVERKFHPPKKSGAIASSPGLKARFFKSLVAKNCAAANIDKREPKFYDGILGRRTRSPGFTRYDRAVIREAAKPLTKSSRPWGNTASAATRFMNMYQFQMTTLYANGNTCRLTIPLDRRCEEGCVNKTAKM